MTSRAATLGPRARAVRKVSAGPGALHARRSSALARPSARVVRGVLTLPLMVAACAAPPVAAPPIASWASELSAAVVVGAAAQPRLAAALRSPEPARRAAALTVLAQLAPPGTSTLAAGLLSDPDPEVAARAAFALGQLADPEAERALRSALRTPASRSPAVLRALGRVGTASAAEDVAALLADRSPELRSAAAFALGLLGKRHPAAGLVRHAPLLSPLIGDPVAEVRAGAAYALMRLPGSVAAIALIPALGDRDPEVRANAARGLGLAGAGPHALDAVIADPDWRVRFEVARALGEIGRRHPEDAEAAGARLAVLAARELGRFERADPLDSGRATHVLLGAVEAVGALGGAHDAALVAIEKADWGKVRLAPASEADLARVLCEVAALRDRREGVVRRVRSCGAPHVAEWRRLALTAKLLAEQGPASLAELESLTRHQDPRVRLAAVEAVGELQASVVAPLLLPLLDSNDPFLAAAALDRLTQERFAGTRPTGFGGRVERALLRLSEAPDASLITGALENLPALGQEALAALPALDWLRADPRLAVRRRAQAAAERLGGGPRAPVRVRATPPGQAAPMPWAGRAVLHLSTSRGPVALEIDGRRAPRTVGALLALVRRGFFDGLTFHRVVPDFVVQGGCPRGDGSGGPGFELVSEHSPEPFARGAVGIATSGRDTGGSQLFVMHAHHPHLDGGYAQIGRVRSGIEVLDALQVDDVIVSASIELEALEQPGAP
jgi:cyclophilin family peptidyl-prolyl cis-trans isomerase/HEAT repeat protein